MNAIKQNSNIIIFSFRVVYTSFLWVHRKVESEEEIYFWNYHEVINSFKAFGNWFNAGFEAGIAVKEIRPGSIVKVYIWSEDRQTIYIDDVRINVLQ